jgi:hypothetical protein
MATPSLFGMLGDEAAMQRQLDEQRAQAFAEQTQEQRLAGMGYQAGAGLGRAVAGMFGADTTDPVVRKASQVRQLASQFDTTQPEGMMKFAQAVQAIDPNLAVQAAQQAQSMMKTSSEISKNLRERDSADPFQQFLRSAVGKVDPKSLAAYQQSGNVADLEWTEKPNQTEIARLQAYRNTLPEGSRERGEVDAVIKATAEGRGTKINISPEIKQAPDIVGAVNAFDEAVKKEAAMLESAGLAKQLINQTAKSNNSQAWEAARTTVAKAVGENKLSNEDIRRTGVDPRLVEGALDWVNKKIEGVPNQDIQKQLYVLSTVLENNAKARYDAKALRTRAAAEATGFKGNVKTYFPTSTERTGTTPSNVVDWSSLK